MPRPSVVYIPPPNDRLARHLRRILESADAEPDTAVDFTALTHWTHEPDAMRAVGNADALVIGPGAESVVYAIPEVRRLRLVHFTGCLQRGEAVHAVQRCGVTVCDAGPALSRFSAAQTMGLILAALKAAGHTGPASYLQGLTVGVIGVGNIGSAVARRAHALGANVIYHDIRTAPQSFTVEAAARRMTLDRLLINSDVVTIHASDTPHSRGMIGARELRLMKTGSVLVNMSHPEVLNETDVAEALNRRAPAAVAINVQRHAAADSHRQLAGRADVILDTTVVTDSDECAEAVATFVARNLKRWAAAEELQGVMESVGWPAAGDPAFWSSRLPPRRLD